MSKFKPTNAKKKDLTPEESAKLEAFGNEATTNPGTLGENGKTPEAKSPTNLDTISPTPSRTELVSNQNETSEEANRKPRAKKAKKWLGNQFHNQTHDIFSSLSEYPLLPDLGDLD